MKPLITVIVNVYNCEKYIERCLDSIINQTYKNLEIIVVNDGSTDNTLSLINKHKDKRVKIITTKNMGLSNSRNVGLDNAHGDYIYFVDSDDYIEKDAIEYLYNLCIKYNVSLATTDAFVVVNDKYKINKAKEKIEVLQDIDMIKKILLSIGRNGCTWNKLMKKELFDNFRFENRFVNDVVTTHKFAIRAKQYVYSNVQKYYYYRHPESILAIQPTIRSIDFYQGILERYNYLKKIYPNLKENEYCILWSIAELYSQDDKELNDYLNKEKAMELFKKKFTIKVLFSNYKLKNKLKIIIFRICPKFWIKLKSLVKHYKNKK